MTSINQTLILVNSVKPVWVIYFFVGDAGLYFEIETKRIHRQYLPWISFVSCFHHRDIFMESSSMFISYSFKSRWLCYAILCCTCCIVFSCTTLKKRQYNSSEWTLGWQVASVDPWTYLISILHHFSMHQILILGVRICNNPMFVFF